jgi:predicted DNA-binding transcriptional regulator YafY
MTPALVGKAQRMYDARTFTVAEIAASAGVTPATVYRHIRTDKPAAPGLGGRSGAVSAPRRTGAPQGGSP